jgi:hypothetical protein
VDKKDRSELTARARLAKEAARADAHKADMLAGEIEARAYKLREVSSLDLYDSPGYQYGVIPDEIFDKANDVRRKASDLAERYDNTAANGRANAKACGKTAALQCSVAAAAARTPDEVERLNGAVRAAGGGDAQDRGDRGQAGGAARQDRGAHRRGGQRRRTTSGTARKRRSSGALKWCKIQLRSDPEWRRRRSSPTAARACGLIAHQTIYRREKGDGPIDFIDYSEQAALASQREFVLNQGDHVEWTNELEVAKGVSLSVVRNFGCEDDPEPAQWLVLCPTCAMGFKTWWLEGKKSDSPFAVTLGVKPK